MARISNLKCLAQMCVFVLFFLHFWFQVLNQSFKKYNYELHFFENHVIRIDSKNQYLIE